MDTRICRHIILIISIAITWANCRRSWLVLGGEHLGKLFLSIVIGWARNVLSGNAILILEGLEVPLCLRVELGRERLVCQPVVSPLSLGDADGSESIFSGPLPNANGAVRRSAGAESRSVNDAQCVYQART